MRKKLKIVAWTIGVLIVLPIVAVAIVMVVANTDPGRRFVERTATQLSGGRVALSGLTGHFPDDLRVAHASIRDAQGAWINIDDVTLQWSPSQLLRKNAHIEVLRVGRLQLLRAPSTSPEQEKKPFSLPMRIDIDRLEADRIELDAPVAGAAATVTMEGAMHIASLQNGEAALSVKRIDAPGSYKLNARMDGSFVNAELVVDEPAQGLLSGLAKLPDLGALSIQLNVDGPRSKESMHFAVAAGPLRASGEGLVDLVGQTLDFDITANAPAMAPRPDLRWQSISLTAHVHGPFTRPDATGELRIAELNAGDGHAHSVRADVQGNQGKVTLHAVLDRLRLPGPKPALLESAPVDLRIDAQLDDPMRPVKFELSHPLISVQGHANTAGDISAALTLDAPALAPFAAIAGMDIKGNTILNANVTNRDQVTSIAVSGTVGVTGGTAHLPQLIGNAAKIDVVASLKDDEVTVERAQVNGKTLNASATGTSKRDRLDFNWKVALSDLAALTPTVSGRIDARGRLQGSRDNLELTADAAGEAGTAGFPRGPVKVSARLRGLTNSPSGNVEASGTLNGSPLQLAVNLERNRDGAMHGTIARADWKSAHAEGDVTVRAGVPEGRVAMRIAKLDDLRPWIGQSLQGSIAANVNLVQTSGHAQAKVQLDARNVDIDGSRVDHVTLTGSIDNPTTHPIVALQLAADGIAAKGISGSARLEANGPQEALKLKLTSDLHNVGEADARFSSTATFDANTKQVAVSTLQGQYREQNVRLLAPMRVSFGEGLAVDRLRIGMQNAVLEVGGRVSPTLDLTASVRNVTPELARMFVPDLQADGTLTMDARLNGTIAQPTGTVRMSANGLHMRTGSARTLPPVNIVATANLNVQSARVDAQLSAGNQMRLNATGQVPLSAAGTIDVHANGTIDAAIANPMLEVNGRRAKGQITADLGVRGTFAAPGVSGTLRLADGDIQDYALGAHLTKVDALIEASGDTMRIANLTARAGPGTLSASGTFGVFVPGRPVDVKLTARNAQPLASDLLTANMDLDLTLRGPSQTRVEAAGTIKINHADINIPNALPPNVAVLDVRRPGQKPPPPAAPAAVIGLDLKVDAPRAVFVRGRGLDAEVGGELHVGGTSASPRIGGGLDMRRGTFDLAGASLKFTSGKVSFTGTGVTQKIDPTLDFEAQSSANNITAKLNVTGYADAPKIALTSTPELPQDEILAHLLFGVSVKQLSALQIAQIGAALATLGGVGGGGVNPLLAVQKSLGLDRLSVGSATAGGASVEAGRYVSERVYVGAKQTTSGNTQAQVQVDLTKNLKVQATIGTGGSVQGSTPDNDPGTSVGLSYQFEY